MENLLNRAVTHPPYLEVLNPEQREAVFHTGNPLLILAGAGSGKTRVITTKIAYLIREKGVDPRSILAVTFTNRAAREMADRARLIDDRAAYTMLRTFHSFGAWFLRRNGSFAGLDSRFTIYDDKDMISLLALIMENASKGEIKHIAHSIARAKDYFLSPDDPQLSLIDYRKEFRRVYAQYEERLAQIGNVDFGDLIKKPVEILRTQREVAERFRDRFRVIPFPRRGGTEYSGISGSLCGNRHNPAGTELPVYSSYSERSVLGREPQSGQAGKNPYCRAGRREKAGFGLSSESG